MRGIFFMDENGNYAKIYRAMAFDRPKVAVKANGARTKRTRRRNLEMVREDMSFLGISQPQLRRRDRFDFYDGVGQSRSRCRDGYRSHLTSRFDQGDAFPLKKFSFHRQVRGAVGAVAIVHTGD